MSLVIVDGWTFQLGAPVRVTVAAIHRPGYCPTFATSRGHLLAWSEPRGALLVEFRESGRRRWVAPEFVRADKEVA